MPRGGKRAKAKAVPKDQPDVETRKDSKGEYKATLGPSGITWRIEKRRVGDLKEWERNPRRLSDSQAKHLATSIIKFGMADIPQVNTDDKIIGGHQRLRILVQAGMVTLDDQIDIYVPSRLLTPEEHEELALRLNKNTGDWDWEALSTNFDQNFLREVGFSPMDFGMVASKGIDGFEAKKVDPEPLKESRMKPARPRTCTHCSEPCHCVVEES